MGPAFQLEILCDSLAMGTCACYVLQGPPQLRWALLALRVRTESCSRCLHVGVWWRGTITPLAQLAPALLLQPRCSWLPQLQGSLLPHHQLSAHQSPNAIPGKLFFIQPQSFLLPGAISSRGLVVAVVAFMRQVPVSPFSTTLSCCSPAMTTPPHICRGRQACGSFLLLSVVKSCVSNDWY